MDPQDERPARQVDSMPKYRVQLDAKNFLIDMEGTLAKHGFITFRFVEAEDPAAAEEAAVEMVRDDRQFRESILNDPSDPPVIDVMEIAEVESFEPLENQPGRIWYEMNPKRWWQFWRRSM